MTDRKERVGEVLAEHGLATYMGGKVTDIGLAVRNTGHGLEETVGVDPVVIPPGQKAFVVFEVDPEKHRYDEVTSGTGAEKIWTGEWKLVQMLKAGTCVVLDGESGLVIREAVREQAVRNQIARDAAKGTQQFDYALADAHGRGEHADGPVEGCGPCEFESALTRLETAGVLTDRPQTMTDEEWEASVRSQAAEVEDPPSEIQQAQADAKAKRGARSAAVDQTEGDPAE